MNARTARPLLATLLAATMLTSLTGCGMLQRPDARITGMRLEDAGLTEATMLFDVTVENPYTVPLPMSDVDYALSSKGQEFLTGKADVAGTVPASGTRTLGVPVRVSYLDLVRVVEGARPGVTIPYKADMGLSVDVPAIGPLRVPMTKEGELTIPTGPALLEKLKDLAK